MQDDAIVMKWRLMGFFLFKKIKKNFFFLKFEITQEKNNLIYKADDKMNDNFDENLLKNFIKIIFKEEK